LKKRTIISLLLLSLLLAACGTAPTASTVSSGSATAEALPAASQLILGTFKLEGTDHAVTAEQAAQLLPLWQVYRELSTSDTAAQAEVEALVEQVQETMTSSQMKAINTMGLTQNDIATVMAEQKVVEAAPLANTSTTVSSGAALGGPVGEMPPADMGDDPAMGAAGMEPVSASGRSSDSTSVQPAGSTGIPSALIDALVSRKWKVESGKWRGEKKEERGREPVNSRRLAGGSAAMEGAGQRRKVKEGRGKWK
jgi:hypothetical protein